MDKIVGKLKDGLWHGVKIKYDNDATDVNSDDDLAPFLHNLYYTNP